MSARIAVPPNFDMAEICRAAGSGGVANRYYENGYLIVNDVSQEALDAALAAYDPVRPSVPDVVTMRQARLALLQHGLLSQVNTSIANMPGAAGDTARIEWEFSSTVERNRPLVQSLVGALGLTDAQLDDLFTLAATL